MCDNFPEVQNPMPDTPRNFRLDIAYDGANYHGWQTQPRGVTIQSELNAALSKLFAEKVVANGAGRTDSGAHALCYTAAFRAYNPAVPADKVRMALNGILPPDIRVLDAGEVNAKFHAQFSATAREYVYLAASADTPLPQFRNYIHFVRPDRFPEGTGELAKCAKLFVGSKDFTQFCYGYRSISNETVETLRRVDYFRVAAWQAFGMKGVAFTIRANGFLRGMIRTLVSVCLNYSAGKLTEDEIIRSLAGESAIPSFKKAAVPACGLYFKRAYYPRAIPSES